MTIDYPFQSIKEMEESSKGKKKKRKAADLDDDDDMEGTSGVRKRLKKGKSMFSKKKFKNNK